MQGLATNIVDFCTHMPGIRKTENLRLQGPSFAKESQCCQVPKLLSGQYIKSSANFGKSLASFTKHQCSVKPKGLKEIKINFVFVSKVLLLN
jgi:hypothetical protein